MEQFNLNTWLKDKSRKVVTRRGNTVRIICTDRKHGEDDLPIVFLEENNGGEFLLTCRNDGRSDNYDTQYDLFFADEEENLSEDERVRKEIVDYLKKFIPHHDCDLVAKSKEWIAWLEKKDEQKPQGRPALEAWKDMRLEVYQQASGNRHEPNYSDDNTKMFSLTDIDEIFEKLAENKDEQKPVWNEKDEEMFDAIIADIQFTQKAHTHDANQVVYEMEVDWFKSLKDRVQPHTKQKWSEEDERMFFGLKSIVEDWHNTMSEEEKEYYGDCGYINWLKSIKERMKRE